MRRLAYLLIVISALAVSGCASKFKTYNGPEVTRVLIHKQERKMRLMHHDEVLREFDVGLGFAPEGHKQVEGDGRTPEGEYKIDRRNPNSAYHLSIGISYPNEADREYAESIGKSPGGDIFIHGTPFKFALQNRDWTAGCISVSNSEMEDIYAMVRDETPITIHP